MWHTAKAVWLVLALATGTLATDLGPPHALAADSPQDSYSIMDSPYFYQTSKPQDVAALLAAFGASPQASDPKDEPAMIGFLAGAFQRFPHALNTMIPPSLSPTLTWDVAVALHIDGHDAAAKPLFDRLVANGAPPPNFKLMPQSLDSFVPTGAADFDLLWGASFATGDPRYCAKILAGFAAVANVGDRAAVILAIAEDMHSASPTSLHWVTAMYGEQEAMQLFNWSTALWSLDSNAQQHEFVRTMVDNYTHAHPQDPAAKALLAF